MKTNKQNKRSSKTNKELLFRSEQSSENTNSQTAKASEKTPESENTPNSALPTPHSVRPYVNFDERERNRQLAVEKVLAVLRHWMPRQYELAEVVGKWIWISFPEQPAEHVRAELSQLGFHWNNTRKCWQHPCGETLPRGTQEPREKYPTYFPADTVAA